MRQYMDCKHILLVIFVLNDVLRCCKCEVFTSVAQMEYLVDYQSEFSKILRNHIKNTQIYIDRVRAELTEMREFDTVVSGLAQARSRKNCSQSPGSINVLIKLFQSMRKREKLAHYIKGLENQRKHLSEYVQNTRSRLSTREDVDGAAMAILRLQETYKINTESFLRVMLQDGRLNQSLHLDDLFYIGRRAYLNNKMALTSQWMKAALRFDIANRDEVYSLGRSGDGINYEVDIRDHLVYSEYRMGKYDTALTYTREILSRDPKNENALTNIEVIEDKLADSHQNNNEKSEGQGDKFHADDTYEKLCRGEKRSEDTKEKSNQNQLLCGYSNKDPRLKIRPIKYEVLSTSPEIYLYHQLATNHELKVLKRLALPQLKRATVADIDTKKLQVAAYRISKSGWLSDEDHEIVKRISQRMEAVTGLSSKTAEDLQIANYGIGGHYEPHYDWSVNYKNSEMEKFGQGNRIATCLLYLNDIDAGGATVFMDPKIAIWPQKGSMAFWYNLHRNGTGKQNTVHAACPVLLGSKWVANKWFHEKGQEYTRPCSLNRML